MTRRLINVAITSMVAGFAVLAYAPPANAAVRTCTFYTYAGAYYTYYANCNGNVAVDAANGRYIEQFNNGAGLAYYTLTTAPSTNATASPAPIDGRMRFYVGGYTLSGSGSSVACQNQGGNTYLCYWG